MQGIALACLIAAILWPVRGSRAFSSALHDTVDSLRMFFDASDSAYLSPVAGGKAGLSVRSHRREETPKGNLEDNALVSPANEVQVRRSIAEKRRACEVHLQQLDERIVDAINEPPFLGGSFPATQARFAQDCLQELFAALARYDFVLRSMVADELLCADDQFWLEIPKGKPAPDTESFHVLGVTQVESKSGVVKVCYPSRVHYLFGALFPSLQKLRWSLVDALDEVTKSIDDKDYSSMGRTGDALIFEGLGNDFDAESAPRDGAIGRARQVLRLYESIAIKARTNVHHEVEAMSSRLAEETALAESVARGFEKDGLLPRTVELISFNALIGCLLQISLRIAHLQDSFRRLAAVDAFGR